MTKLPFWITPLCVATEIVSDVASIAFKPIEITAAVVAPVVKGTREVLEDVVKEIEG